MRHKLKKRQVGWPKVNGVKVDYQYRGFYLVDVSLNLYQDPQPCWAILKKPYSYHDHNKPYFVEGHTMTLEEATAKIDLMVDGNSLTFIKEA